MATKKGKTPKTAAEVKVTEIDAKSGKITKTEKPIITIETVMAPVEPKARAVVLANISDIQRMLAQIGQTRLAIGGKLHEIRKTLLPLEQWENFQKVFPSMSRATVNRYVLAFEAAQKLLPPVVVRRALTEGIDIGSHEPTKPYGKYQDAFEKLIEQNDAEYNKMLKDSQEVGKDKLPTKVAEDAAAALLEKVVSYQRKLDAAGRDKKQIHEKFSVALALEYHKDALAALKRNFDKVPQNKAVGWVKQFLSYALAVVQLPSQHIEPVETLPEEFQTKAKGRKTNETKKDESKKDETKKAKGKAAAE